MNAGQFLLLAQTIESIPDETFKHMFQESYPLVSDKYAEGKLRLFRRHSFNWLRRYPEVAQKMYDWAMLKAMGFDQNTS